MFADLDIPLEGDIEVAVFNGSDVAGLGRQAATEFAARGFQVTRWEADESRPDSLAVLRFGPAAVGRATLVNAYLFGRARLEHDAARQGRTVDVVVGKDFKQVATPAEKDQALGMIGLPRPPDGTCAR